MVLDNAKYFTAKKIQEYAETIPLGLCFLPRGSTRVNPAEECWLLLPPRNSEISSFMNFTSFMMVHSLRLSLLTR